MIRGAARSAPAGLPVVTLPLNNGVEVPALGFGVFQTPPAETVEAVATALRTGHRHIDTAAAYATSVRVGEAIRRSGVDRAGVYGYDATPHAFDRSAGKLGVDTIELLILHQVPPSRFDPVIAGIAGTPGRTPARVMLRRHLQRAGRRSHSRPGRHGSWRTSPCSTSAASGRSSPGTTPDPADNGWVGPSPRAAALGTAPEPHGGALGTCFRVPLPGRRGVWSR